MARTPTRSVAPGPPVPVWQGYYHGSATIDGATVQMDALLLPDGQVRMRIGEASDDFGLVRPSSQYVGTYQWHETGVTGTGAVIGQGCAGSDAGSLCGGSVAAALNLVADGYFGAIPERARLAGTLEVFGESGTETWSISTGWLDQAYASSAVWHYSGQFVAYPWTEITSATTVMTVDATGSIFLQSPVSGCVANGIIETDYRVTMTIDSCAGEFGYLNGEYAGLISGFCADPWDYACFGLSAWLSAPDPAAPPAAVTITAAWLPTDP